METQVLAAAGSQIALFSKGTRWQPTVRPDVRQQGEGRTSFLWLAGPSEPQMEAVEGRLLCAQDSGNKGICCPTGLRPQPPPLGLFPAFVQDPMWLSRQKSLELSDTARVAQGSLSLPLDSHRKVLCTPAKFR